MNNIPKFSQFFTIKKITKNQIFSSLNFHIISYLLGIEDVSHKNPRLFIKSSSLIFYQNLYLNKTFMKCFKK